MFSNTHRLKGVSSKCLDFFLLECSFLRSFHSGSCSGQASLTLGTRTTEDIIPDASGKFDQAEGNSPGIVPLKIDKSLLLFKMRFFGTIATGGAPTYGWNVISVGIAQF